MCCKAFIRLQKIKDSNQPYTICSFKTTAGSMLCCAVLCCAVGKCLSLSQHLCPLDSMFYTQTLSTESLLRHPFLNSKCCQNAVIKAS